MHCHPDPLGVLSVLREIHKVVGAPSPYVYLSHLHPHILK